MESDLSTQILKIISEADEISSLDIAKQLNVDHQQAVGAIKSIIAQASSISDKFLILDNKQLKQLDLTDEGKMILEHGSHEARVYKLVSTHVDGIDQSSLAKSFTSPLVAKNGTNKAMSNGWIAIDQQTKKFRSKVTSIEDHVHDLVTKISMREKVDDAKVAELRKRKLVVENIIKYLIVKKDVDFSLTIETTETDLTTELLQSGDWRMGKFKKYNFNSLGAELERGHLHPLLKVREQFRQIFLEMGFSEMPTNNFVENSFWNFDTLVVPQAHPARDSQDTFFVSKPSTSSPISDRDLVERTKFAHEGSVDGSWPRGYQYDWSEEESRKNVLRTHTTAVSARMLYKMSSEFKKTGILKPTKIFSIDRVFRNETLDATHLAEFNQVEGVVLDEDLTLGDLMGVLEAFFKKLGIHKLRFKPAYNPYTEPSMEIFSYHPGLKKWVEVGNSGVFRPEMLTALGMPENATAIAWGLSLERPTMIKYKINNIRELVGHKVNLQMVYDSPLCLF